MVIFINGKRGVLDFKWQEVFEAIKEPKIVITNKLICAVAATKILGIISLKIFCKSLSLKLNIFRKRKPSFNKIGT